MNCHSKQIDNGVLLNSPSYHFHTCPRSIPRVLLPRANTITKAIRESNHLDNSNKITMSSVTEEQVPTEEERKAMKAKKLAEDDEKNGVKPRTTVPPVLKKQVTRYGTTMHPLARRRHRWKTLYGNKAKNITMATNQSPLSDSGQSLQKVTMPP